MNRTFTERLRKQIFQVFTRYHQVMFLKELRMRFNCRVWLRYLVYIGYFYVLYLLITRLQLSFPNVAQNPPMKQAQDTRSVAESTSDTDTNPDTHTGTESDTESDTDETDPRHEDTLKFKPRKKGKRQKDDDDVTEESDTDLVTYAGEEPDKERAGLQQGKKPKPKKHKKEQRKGKQKKKNNKKKARDDGDDTDTINTETSDTQPLVMTRYDEDVEKVKPKQHDADNDNNDESELQHMTVHKDDDTDESEDIVNYTDDNPEEEWARTDDTSYTETEVMEPRVFDELSLQYFNYYDKYIQNNSILEVRPENIFDVPKLKFLPNLRNPCFFVRNDNSDRIFGDSYAEKDFDALPGLALKCLPYFFVCATEKSGTSDLYHRLQGHQSINFAYWKEIYFFNGQQIRFNKRRIRFNFGGYFKVFSEGHGMIRDCFDQQVKRQESNPSSTKNVTCPQVLCDATPRYLHSDFGGLGEPGQLAPHKIKHLLGNRPKLIMMFRNPTDRLLSDYRYFERQKGRGRKTSAQEFHMRVKASEKTFHKCVAKYSERQCIYKFNLSDFARKEKNLGFNNVMAMSRMCIGMYVEFLKTWFSVFPRKNFHIILFEEYIKNPNEYIKSKILPFLGLEPFDEEAEEFLDEISNEVINKNPDMAKPTRMWDETRVILNRVYKPYNERLAKLLKDDRFLWKESE